MNGPEIIFKIPLFGGIAVTETIVTMWIVMAVVALVCYYLGRNLKIVPETKKQIAAEKIVEMLYSFVKNTMGEKNLKYAPYIGTLFTMSILGSLLGLIAVRPYTADLSVTIGFALVTFIMVQYNSIKKSGILGWLKGFVEPVPFMLPLNVVGEIANPVSMSFRHFGNIAAGMVITSLVYGALAFLSSKVLGFIPNEFIRNIPVLQAGLPAILSLYFDLFSSFLQAYIICMLTMVFVKNATE